METVETLVIGAGVVGLAIARALALSGREVLVLERAEAIGTQTSARNSEVIHAGLYYATGSLKARTCVAGKRWLYDYCEARGLSHARLGKLVVGADESAREGLARLKSQAESAGVNDLIWLDKAGIKDIEPEVEAAVGLFSPSTGIIDSHGLMLALQGDAEGAGAQVILYTEIQAAVLGQRRGQPHQVRLLSQGQEMELACETLINAAGLLAPQTAQRFQGLAVEHIPQAFYAKGHYFSLTGKSPFTHLVYPLPTNASLGIHVTLDLAGQARFGPDCVWLEEIDYSFDEGRRDAFVEGIQAYYPGLDPDRLVPGYTGIRPKIVGPGAPAADFRVDGPQTHAIPGLVNLFGIESPGLTASAALAEEVMRCLDQPLPLAANLDR